MQSKHLNHLFGTAQLELVQAATLFDSVKDLLDVAAGMDRLGVALVTRGASVEGGTTGAACVLRHVRRHADAAHLSDKSPCFVVLVGADGLPVGTGRGSRHGFGGIPLPSAHRLSDAAVHDQGMTVIHEHVPSVAGECRVGVGFLAK